MRKCGGCAWVVLMIAAVLAVPASASAAFEPLASFGPEGEAAGQTREAGAAAIAANGDLYVTDWGNDRVDVFSAADEFLFAFGREVVPAPGEGDVCTAASGCRAGPSEGHAAGAMSGPEGIAVGPEGNLFVGDTGNNRVDVFSPQGTFQFAFGREVDSGTGADVCTTECRAGAEAEVGGALVWPDGVAFDPISGYLYVSNGLNDRVEAFTVGTASAEFAFAFGREVNRGAGDLDVCTEAAECRTGQTDGQAGAIVEPIDLAVAPDGELAVGDYRNHRISVFTEGGEFVRAFGLGVNAGDGDPNVCTTACQGGTASAGAGGLLSPNGLSIDEAGSLYVSDVEADRIDQFGLDGSFVRAFGLGVVDGSAAFQVCTSATGCRAGSAGTAAGAVSRPFGVEARGGEVLAMESGPSRIEVFGQPAAPSSTPSETSTGTPAETTAPSNRFSFGKLALNQKKGTATLTVRVPGAGKLALSGSGIAKAKRGAAKAGSVKLPVKLTGKAKRALLKAGKAKVTAKVAFTPTGGATAKKTKKLTLKKKLG